MIIGRPGTGERKYGIRMPARLPRVDRLQVRAAERDAGRPGAKEIARMTCSLYTFLAEGFAVVAHGAGANKAASPKPS